MLMLWLALTAGNVVYACLTSRRDKWLVAVERSFIEGVAIGLCWMMDGGGF